MKACKREFGLEQCLCLSVALLVLLVLGLGVFDITRNRERLEDPASQDSAEGAEKLVVGEISSEEVRLNTFLTAVVQQNIENLKTDLDEDAELIRFAFGYRRANAPTSVSEQESDGVLCRTLTLDEVNETLTYFFGVAVSPDRTDYSISQGAAGTFHCVYREGRFWNIPPYPVERFDFPLRFALTETIDRKTSTIYFRLYKLNPDGWQVGEAERHVVLAPLMSIFIIENGNNETKEWIKRLGTGYATFRDLGEDLRLLDLKITMGD